ncbi:MAG: DUF1738 domain-containing protein [Bacteroidetes bacterium]|nr:MAG: DUF1738 domain-containing protein [Bacteroidota bacterium]REK05191.1 MAG: DUF1738 domain-containing protein [Bacteroidota bacterium]REK32596.1 MAG: DUF1738 domain-containing protein [Bacteroidota bacterium]REK48957.1 MAG: DUF1738 domain-containing protein [Bacteroidota bacterium]
MTTATENIKTSFNDNQNIYSKVTQKIIADLEKGELSWRQKDSQAIHFIRPLRSNGVPFTGINRLILAGSASANGFQSPYWMTLRQATDLNASIPVDQQSTTVVFADKVVTEGQGEDGEPLKQESTQLKEYSVYNADQIEGLQDFHYKKPELINKKNRLKTLEKFIAGTKAEINTGSVASYDASSDKIEMTPSSSFANQEAYYGAVLNELIHWTQHESRLNRDFKKERNGNHILAKEALVAELGYCFLTAELGIEPTADVHSAFVKSWLQILKHDSKFIFIAASQAQKAVDYLISLQPLNEPKPRSVAAEPKPSGKANPAF